MSVDLLHIFQDNVSSICESTTNTLIIFYKATVDQCVKNINIGTFVVKKYLYSFDTGEYPESLA